MIATHVDVVSDPFEAKHFADVEPKQYVLPQIAPGRSCARAQNLPEFAVERQAHAAQQAVVPDEVPKPPKDSCHKFAPKKALAREKASEPQDEE
jgi:hypothetical protein